MDSLFAAARKLYPSLLAVAATAALVGSPATAGAVSPSAVPPQGTRTVRAAGAGWQQVFRDDFSTTSLDAAHWGRYSGRAGGNGAGHWRRSNVFADGGVLTLRSIKVRRRIVSAGVSLHTVALRYGKWNVRMRMDRATNIKFAMLLWPKDNHWPPEVDFAENDGATRARVNTWLHYGHRNEQVGRTLGFVNTRRWHDFGIQWRPGLVEYLVDGRIVARVRQHVPRKAMWLAIQTEGLAAATRRTPTITDMQIDNVTVWRWNG